MNNYNLKKRRLFPSTFSLLICLLFFVSAHSQIDTLSYAKECHVREGLPNFFSRLNKHQPVTIAYFGGSITAASGGWREQSLAQMKQKYPGVIISSVNATIGGTGSDLGAFRLKKEVLDMNPHLVFVEFAVNDYNKDTMQIHQAMEGIVRQIWKHNRKTDICFVYTFSGAMVESLQQHMLPASARAMEDVAQHYQIPGVHLGLEVIDLITSDRMILKGGKNSDSTKMVFSGDAVHPYAETGHRLYTEALMRSLSLLSKGVPSKPTNHILSKPFNKDNWEKARMIPVKQLLKTGDWKQLDTNSSDIGKMMRAPTLVSNQAGSAIIIKFRGTKIGLHDVVGPGCGQYDVYVDGKHLKLYPRFDRFATYNRQQYFILPTLPDGVHEVKLIVSGEQIDKKAILKQDYLNMEHKEMLEGKFCYATSLLLVGHLIK